MLKQLVDYNVMGINPPWLQDYYDKLAIIQDKIEKEKSPYRIEVVDFQSNQVKYIESPESKRIRSQNRSKENTPRNPSFNGIQLQEVVMPTVPYLKQLE